MPRRKRVSLTTNHERWLISYADFVTLLFAFFVVMYSISQVNEGKYRVLADTLNDAFSVANRSINPIQVGDPSLSREPSVIENTDPSLGENLGVGAFEKMADLPELSQQVSDKLADLVDEDLVKINSNEFWLQIELKSSILFGSGSAYPSEQAKKVFKELADIFKDIGNPIQVEGFTDDIPIRSDLYPSNWELSASRAAATVQLLAINGVNPQQLSAVGYGEYQPIARNDSPEGRAQNRRVVLMVAREKIERPTVSADEGIEKAMHAGELVETSIPSKSESSQPDLEDKLGERNDSLDELFNEPEVAEPVTPNLGSPAEPIIKLRSGEGVQAVELEDGGLLFTSDPDLPRQ